MRLFRYEPVQARIIRQFERLGVKTEDPKTYSTFYHNSLLDTEQLLNQLRQLGITEDVVRHFTFDSFEFSSM